MGARPKVGRACVKCGKDIHPFSLPVRIRIRRETFCICEGCSPKHCRNCGAALVSPSGAKLEVGGLELQRVATGACERCRGLDRKPFLAAGLALTAAGVYALLQGSTVGAALAVCGVAVGLAGMLCRRRGLTEEDARRLREESKKRAEEAGK